MDHHTSQQKGDMQKQGNMKDDMKGQEGAMEEKKDGMTGQMDKQQGAGMNAQKN